MKGSESHMKPTISIGIQDFEKIRANRSFYIDKSMLIREWWECRDDVTLITRPRRFGKTLNLSMLNCFFSMAYENRGDLFEGLRIWELESYRHLQGSLPVIYLSFADVKGKDYETARAGIIRKLVKLYSSHIYVKERLNAIDRASFDLVRTDMDDAAATTAIQNMTDYLYQYHGKKALILLDEYDTPLQEAYANGYWEDLTQFIRSLFNSAFKTNPYMERGLLTGITRVSMELDEEIIFDQLEIKRGAIWSLLLASGYLKVTSRHFDPSSGRFTYCLRLTNREVHIMFEDMVKDWFSSENIPYNGFLQAFLQGASDYMNEYMNLVAEQTFSSFDTGNKPSGNANPERFYHGFVLGLIVELAGQYRNATFFALSEL